MNSKMFRSWFAIYVFIALVLGVAKSHAQKAETLVWSDEFEGKTLDYSKWEIEVNAFGGGNQELQLYTDREKNIRVENGHLILEAHKDQPAIQGTQREYSSARIRTKRRGDWTYGRFEISAKMPTGQGVWPAIWMLPSDDTYGSWARSGEIDILELKGQEPEVAWGTLHYGDNWPKNTSTGETFRLPQGSFADDFHVFGLEWQKGEIRWLIDGKVYQKQTKWHSSEAAFPAPFDQPFHMVINLAVGGQFLGNPDATTKFPQQLQVDYVRIYQ